MTVVKSDSQATAFRARPEHNPKERTEKYRRVHYYVSRMGVAISNQLKQALLALRNAAPQLQTEQMRVVASKQYTEDEFLPAVKRLLCIYIHLDAIDQGGELMPAWLMNYLKLALHATDYLIANPEAMHIMESHADCRNMNELTNEVSQIVCETLGHGGCARAFAPAIGTLIKSSQATRNRILKESLTAPLSELGE
jgi:hypothetical protein